MQAHHHKERKAKKMHSVYQVVDEIQLFFDLLHSGEQFVVPVPFIGVHLDGENAETDFKLCLFKPRNEFYNYRFFHFLRI
jgi:hypothetical protein